MCTVLLPPGVNPIAVDKYINIPIITQKSAVLSYFAAEVWKLAQCSKCSNSYL